MNPVAVTLPQGPELIVILVVVILLFGAKKLPELGSSVGKSIKNFKAGMTEAREDESSPAEGASAEETAPAARDPQ